MFRSANPEDQRLGATATFTDFVRLGFLELNRKQRDYTNRMFQWYTANISHNLLPAWILVRCSNSKRLDPSFPPTTGAKTGSGTWHYVGTIYIYISIYKHPSLMGTFHLVVIWLCLKIRRSELHVFRGHQFERIP